MALEVMAVLKEEEAGQVGAAPPADSVPAVSTLSLSTIKLLFDLLWKIGVVVLLLGKSYFTQGTMERDIAEIKGHVEKQQVDANNYAQRLSALESSYKSLQQNVNDNAEFLRLIERDRK